VLKDPRLKVPQRAFEQQAALLHRLYAAWSRLNEGVNTLRRLKRQLGEVPQRLGAGDGALAERGAALIAALEAIEGELVDRHRESVRDVLRHRAGLNDTLADLISVVAIADEAPTRQARELSDESIARVDALLDQLDGLLRSEVAEWAAGLEQAGVGAISVRR
jgi:DNA anti-recombination protein RmuC